MTQEQLAKASDVREATICNIENGLIAKPHAGTIYRLAKALGVSVHELTRDVPEPAPDAPPPSGPS